MAQPRKLVLKVYVELSLESRQYVKWGPGMTLWMAWMIFTTLSSIFYNIAL